MAKKSVFVSFDWDHDRKYKHLLEAWDANPKFDFVFNDQTPGEIKTNDIARIKGGLTTKINQANYTLFIVGAHANTRHKFSQQIGYVNWINFEAAKSVANDNKLAFVKLVEAYDPPTEGLKKSGWMITGFTEANVLTALDKAP